MSPVFTTDLVVDNYLAPLTIYRCRISDDADDMITVKCPDREDGTGRVFEFQRSTLKRSPTFAHFFDSLSCPILDQWPLRVV